MGARATHDRFPAPFGPITVFAVIALLALLWNSAPRVEMDRAAAQVWDAVRVGTGADGHSQVLEGGAHVLGGLLPIQMELRTEIDDLDTFDAQNLPPFARLERERRSEETLDPLTFEPVTRVAVVTVLVEPIGYAAVVAEKLVITIEMAAWATLIALALSAPLAWCAARPLGAAAPLRWGARTVVAFLRAMPDLVLALFLVMAFGFGPAAGVLALSLHATGFLAKFFADDIEAADLRAHTALEAMGVGKVVALRAAILPQVAPQFVAYTLYILDRNVRMATVIGLVGAGGIGQELKGRFDLYQFAHVGTILAGVFLVVLALDLFSSALRRRIMKQH